MWELQLDGDGVEGLSGLILNLELVGVLIELEDLEDLGNNIEVGVGLGGVLEGGGSAILHDITR